MIRNDGRGIRGEEELKEDRDICGRVDKMGQEVKGVNKAD